MLQHYGVDIVRIGYALAFISLLPKMVPNPFLFVLLAGWCASVDYYAHKEIHDELHVPWGTVGWIGIMTMTMFVFPPFEGNAGKYQFAGLILLQSLWDLSCHSIQHHREPDDTPTHTDKHWVRVAVLTAAIMIVIMPHVTTTLYAQHVPQVWWHWWYGPIVC